MNLLCDYENYLRDRYILGQPVRYMYGGFGDASSGASASQSKQKVYGPDGNEYTYIDDPTSPNAGRYYRNVGGPGGGRIVFLDEVQEADQKRQMEDASKAAQPQAEQPQNVQKTEPPAQPKETEARKPSKNKTPETKSWLDLEPIDNAGIEETIKSLLEEHRPELSGEKRTFFPGLISVDSYRLGYNINPYQTTVDLDTICRSLMRDDVAFFEGDPDSMAFYDGPKDKIVLESWGGGKRRFTPRELYEFIKEKYIEQYGEESDYHPIETSVSDLSFDLPLGKKGVSPARYSPAFRADKKSDFERDVAYAVRDLSDLDAWLADPTEEIPRDLYRPLYDCAIRISKSAPPYYAEDKDKKEYLARDASLRNALGLAVFIPNSNDRLAKTKANELAKEFIGAALSETPNKGLAALRKKAKRLGFAINSDAPDKWDVFQANVEYTTPQAAQEPEPKDVITRDAETTALDTAESETATLERDPFDVSGLGLPGSQDSVLDAKEGDNRDAAYFIRRDLGEEKPQDSATEAYDASGATEQNGAEGESPEVSVFIDSYNKYRAETKKIASLERKAAKVKKTVRKPSAQITKEELEARRQELVRIREEIKEAEVAVDELSKGLNEFSQKNSAVFIDDDTFIIAPSRETVAALRNRKGAADRLKELEKLAKRGKKKANGQSTVPPGLQKQIKNLEDKLNEANDKVLELLKRETVVSARSNGETSRVLPPEPKNIVARETKVSRQGNVETPVAQDTPTATLEPTPQEQPAKPRPERWTPLKSAMNDDDKRVVESTRQRLNFGLADFAWRIANAKERKDWQKVKELTVLASQRYLELARRAYRSHGGAEALAAFDESLAGDGLTVGQVRDRIVDKFRKLALMNTGDLYKYAGERLDDLDRYHQTNGASSSKRGIALKNLLDKQGRLSSGVAKQASPEYGKIYERPVGSLGIDPSRFQFKLGTNEQGVTDELEGAEFDPEQAGIISVWRDPENGKDYVVNGHHRFNLAKNSGYRGNVNVRYIDAKSADEAKAFGAVANIADQKGTAVDVADFIRSQGHDDLRTPGGYKISVKNKLLNDGRVLSKLDDTIFRKLKNGTVDEKTAMVIAAELPDDKDKQLRLFSDIERLGLDASQAQDRAWAYASIQGEKQQGSLFGDDAPMEYDVESRSKLIGEIKKALSGAKSAARAGGSSKNNEYWNKQGLTSNFDRDRASQLSKAAGKTLQFFKDKIRLTGPMQNVIKEETDAYRKALKEGKDASKVVERAIERIKDVSQGGDGYLRRMEGLGLEPEDRLPSAESKQTRQGVGDAETGSGKQKSPGTPSETARDKRTTGEVLEGGRTDRPTDRGDGRDSASLIADAVSDNNDLAPEVVQQKLNEMSTARSAEPKPKSKAEKRKNDETPLGERSAQRIIAEEVSKSTAPRTRFPKVIDEKIAPLPPEPEDGSEEPEFLKELRKLAAFEQDRENYRPPKFNPDLEPEAYAPEVGFAYKGSVTPRYHRDKEIADAIERWKREQRKGKQGKSGKQRKSDKEPEVINYREIFYPGEKPNEPGRPAIQGVASDGDISKQIEDFDRERVSKGQKKSDVRTGNDKASPKKGRRPKSSKGGKMG